MTKQICVLNDGETYTSLQGCVIREVPEDFEGDDFDGVLESVPLDNPYKLMEFCLEQIAQDERRSLKNKQAAIKTMLHEWGLL